MSRFTVDIYNVDVDKLVYVDILWKSLFREEKEFLGENISLQSTHLKHSSGKEEKIPTLQAPACLSWSLS